MTDPAPTMLSLSIVTGATKEEFEPMKTLSLILVLFSNLIFKPKILIFLLFQIAPFFKIVVDGNQVKKSKPHPEVFLKASMEMGITSKKCVVFEDSQAGIIAAKAAGMTAVAIGDKNDFANYDYCYPNFSSINTSELEMLF